jgi:hypothetical protein
MCLSEAISNCGPVKQEAKKPQHSIRLPEAGALQYALLLLKLLAQTVCGPITVQKIFYYHFPFPTSAADVSQLPFLRLLVLQST